MDECERRRAVGDESRRRDVPRARSDAGIYGVRRDGGRQDQEKPEGGTCSCAGGVCSAATSLNLLYGARGSKLACTRGYMRFRVVATSDDRSGTYSDQCQNSGNISGVYFIRIFFLHKAKMVIIIINYVVRNVVYLSLYFFEKIHLYFVKIML